VRQGSFFDRDADPTKKAAHHRGVGFDPSLGRKAIAQNLKRDVRFLGPRGLQKGPVRHQLESPMAAVTDRLSRAIPFNALKPFDRTDSLIAYRRAAARRLISPLFTASITRSRKSCEYGFAISCWPPPSQQFESKSR
jgi:hypothetical protein